MKKYLLILSFLFVLALPVQAEEILSFDVGIEVREDSSIQVVETIEYDFGTERKHGIYRYVPYKYRARGGNFVTDIDVESVTDELGQAYTKQVSKKGSDVMIKIGDGDVFVSGRKVYIITYTVEDVINYFDTYDELYWNVTGNEWPVAIASATAKVSLPGNVSGDVQTTCFTGVQASSRSDCRVLGNTFVANNLGAKEGLSIVVGFPKGVVVEPSLASKIWKRVAENIIILLPFAVFIFMFRYWKKHGKDPLGKGTVVPEYSAPVDILPAEGGVIIDERMDGHDITATLIDLARRGYLKIKEEDKKVIGIKSGTEWVIIDTGKRDSIKNDLVSYERLLIDGIFDNGKRAEVTLSKLKSDTTFGKDIAAVKKLVYSLVEKNGWFVGDPEKTRKKFIGIGMGLAFVAWFAGGAIASFFGGPIFAVSVISTGILVAAFGFIMPKKTDEGVEMKRRLDGFKMFMSVTEKDRVKFHFSPEKNPEKFADYLPWAIVFKVEKEWAKMFEGINVESPEWYVGRSVTDFNVWMFANGMHSFDNSFRGAMTSASAGAAKGASGFSGGGFSGGGFGGGGGGSW